MLLIIPQVTYYFVAHLLVQVEKLLKSIVSNRPFKKKRNLHRAAVEKYLCVDVVARTIHGHVSHSCKDTSKTSTLTLSGI